MPRRSMIAYGLRRLSQNIPGRVRPQVAVLKFDVSELSNSLSEKQSETLANSRSTVNTSNDPLGKVSKSAEEGCDVPEMPPSLKFVQNLMEMHKGNVVLTQMGSFYELYFDQALKYAPQLNLTLTTKSYAFGKIPFAGFPVPQLNKHLKTLVNDFGYSVTIAEQFKKESVAENEVNKFYRRVTRIVTPGTFIDEAFENYQENTYLLNLEFPDNCFNKIAVNELKVGICWSDVSTGEINVQQVFLKDLASSISRIRPKEILLDEDLLQYHLEDGLWYPELIELKKYFIKYQRMPSKHRTMDTFYSLFTDARNSKTLKVLRQQVESFTQKEVAALRNTLIYLQDHLPDHELNLQLPVRQYTSSVMQIDSRASAALELHTTSRDNNKKGSLLSTLRRTITPGGARLLSQWLSAPSMDINEIKQRHDLVEVFRKNGLTEVIRSILKDVHDITRIVQKFNFGKGEPIDLINIARSLKICNDLKEVLRESDISSTKASKRFVKYISSVFEFDQTLINNVLEHVVVDNLVHGENFATEIAQKSQNTESRSKITSDGDPSVLEIYKGIVNPLYDSRLQQLHESYLSHWQAKELLVHDYKKVFVDGLNAKSVSLKQKPSGEFALYLDGTSSNLKKIDEYIKSEEGGSYSIAQKSSNKRWIIHRSWTKLAPALELALYKVQKMESSIIRDFKLDFIERSNEIRTIAAALDYLDVLCSFAVITEERQFVRPIMESSQILEIHNGRHLTVEEGLANKLETFTANDCNLDVGKAWVITGPNMGGKSTFLRQNAIIVILAQIGCYVPCQYARIGLVDKIFSRVGAADDLYNEMSTFMVEMVETSYILHNATERSLAILDEIGRGTSGREGVGIAYATLRHLTEHNRCRSLFATHFGPEMNELMGPQNNVQYYMTSIRELPSSKILYDHKLVPGISSNSYALHVAESAGFPRSALDLAKSALNKLNCA